MVSINNVYCGMCGKEMEYTGGLKEKKTEHCTIEILYYECDECGDDREIEVEL